MEFSYVVLVGVAEAFELVAFADTETFVGALALVEFYTDSWVEFPLIELWNSWVELDASPSSFLPSYTKSLPKISRTFSLRCSATDLALGLDVICCKWRSSNYSFSIVAESSVSILSISSEL